MDLQNSSMNGTPLVPSGEETHDSKRGSQTAVLLCAALSSYGLPSFIVRAKSQRREPGDDQRSTIASISSPKVASSQPLRENGRRIAASYGMQELNVETVQDVLHVQSTANISVASAGFQIAWNLSVRSADGEDHVLFEKWYPSEPVTPGEELQLAFNDALVLGLPPGSYDAVLALYRIPPGFAAKDLDTEVPETARWAGPVGRKRFTLGD